MRASEGDERTLHEVGDRPHASQPIAYPLFISQNLKIIPHLIHHPSLLRFPPYAPRLLPPCFIHVVINKEQKSSLWKMWTRLFLLSSSSLSLSVSFSLCLYLFFSSPSIFSANLSASQIVNDQNFRLIRSISRLGTLIFFVVRVCFTFHLTVSFFFFFHSFFSLLIYLFCSFSLYVFSNSYSVYWYIPVPKRSDPV